MDRSIGPLDNRPAPVGVAAHQMLRGANRYAPQSALLLKIEAGDAAALFAADRKVDPARIEALTAFPEAGELWQLIVAAAERASGDALPNFVAALVQVLQQPYVIRSGQGTIVLAGEDCRAVLPAEDEKVGLAAWDAAVRIAASVFAEDALTGDRLTALTGRLRRFERLAQARSLDPLTLSLAHAAARLDIPVYRPDPARGAIQLGQGAFRRQAAETCIDTISHVAVHLYSSKWAMICRLRELGVPVLPSFQVGSEDDAVAAAARIGDAVVVKPDRGGKGKGVSVDLKSVEEVRRAYRIAAANGGKVLVERFVSAQDHRLLVVGGKLVAAARREAAQVLGDGRRSVGQLIDGLNADPRRGDGYSRILQRVVVDERLLSLLAKQSLTLNAVPTAGVPVQLSLAANISQGGTSVDVLDVVHSDNRAIAERAASVLGFDVAGVDLLTSDITRSWREAGGWILEANLSPGLRPHWNANPDQDVTTPIVRRLFPVGAPCRIPTAGITGSIGKTTTCRMMATIAEQAGKTAGVATTQGIWSGRFRVSRGDWAGGSAPLRILGDPANEIGVFEFARGGLHSWGMGIDEIDVAAVLNVHDNHIGSAGIGSRRDLAEIKSTLVRAARKAVILNAEDPLVLDMRRHVRDGRLTLVGLDPEHGALAEHRRAGGCVVTIDRAAEPDAAVWLIEGGETLLRLPLREIPASGGGLSRSIAANALFAAGVAHALGLGVDDIRRGLASFTSSAEQNPGRHNWIDGLRCPTMLHWADGVPAMTDLVETIGGVAVRGSRRLLLSCPGNRADDWIMAFASAAAGHFDRYYCADMADLRGRPAGQVPALLRDGLRRAGVGEEQVSVLDGADGALLAAIAMAEPDDLMVVVTYDTDAALSQIVEARGRRL